MRLGKIGERFSANIVTDLGDGGTSSTMLTIGPSSATFIIGRRISTS
jgi:hypothetical protein